MDLWHDLIDFSIDKPYFVHVLLHNIGTHVDPRILIERIENGREIPGLRDSLVQIMHDYQLQVTINFQLNTNKYKPEHIYNPITAMGFSAMFTFQLDNTKR